MRISIRLCRAPFVHLKGNYVSDVVANPTREAYLVRTMLPGHRATGRKGHHKPILTIINRHNFTDEDLRESRQILISVFNLGFNGILDLYITLAVHTIYSRSRCLKHIIG